MQSLSPSIHTHIQPTSTPPSTIPITPPHTHPFSSPIRPRLKGFPSNPSDTHPEVQTSAVKDQTAKTENSRLGKKDIENSKKINNQKYIQAQINSKTLKSKQHTQRKIQTNETANIFEPKRKKAAPTHTPGKRRVALLTSSFLCCSTKMQRFEVDLRDFSLCTWRR